MKKKISIKNLIRPDLQNIKPYSSARDEYSSEVDMTFLDANENPFQSKLNRYPDPYQTILKNEIAQLKSINPDNILLGNGSDEVIDLLVRLFCIPQQDNVLIFPPTYGMYKVVADINNVTVKTVNLDFNFQIDIHKTLGTIDNQTKLLFVCSPNNPTGNSIKRESIKVLLDNFNGIVVVDEAYQDFSKTNSMLEDLNVYENLIVIQTFSKAYGLAGARLGMCFANAQIITFLNYIKPPYNVNSLSQEVALIKLQDKSLADTQIKQLIEERHHLENALKDVPWVEKIYPSDANFILIKVDNAYERYQMFLDQRIVIRNRSSQQGCENCLRISIGTPKENQHLISTINQME